MKALFDFINEELGEQLYFNGVDDWDAPIIATKHNGRFKEKDTLYVSENMYSFVIFSNGQVYVAENESHNGAVMNGLLSIHHLKNEQQLEAKFKEDIDSILSDVRKRCKGEGRFWKKYNILQFTGKDLSDNEKVMNDICKAVNVDPKNVLLLGDNDSDDDDYRLLKKYK